VLRLRAAARGSGAVSPPPLGWLGILRLGLVQAALGAVVVLTTSTLNRVMVVELALPAVLPGLLVGLHYAVQVLRPRFGHGSDSGGRRTPWLLGGMAALCAGGFLAAAAVALMTLSTGAGIALAVAAFLLIGGGVGAAGTTLLVLLAKRVAPARRAAAATAVWLTMIAGFALTAGVAGHFLDPFGPARLLAVAGTVSLAAFLIAALAVRGIEGPAPAAAPAGGPPVRFRLALAQVWAEPRARRFALFVFVSMLAYSAQDLVLEPFAGLAFGLTPGASTQLSGLQHAGVLAGMLAVAALAGRRGPLRLWAAGGCLASALALLGLVAGAASGPGWPLAANVVLLGLANGAFAVGAIGAMMGFAGDGRPAREGVRMGLWGAAQAIAFGLGGLAGAGAADLARLLLGDPAAAYACVFAVEAALFLWAGALALRLDGADRPAVLPQGTAPAGNRG